MTTQGLAEFILELKRTQIRYQMPLAAFVAAGFKLLAKRKANNIAKKEFQKPAVQREKYARHIDASIAAWEQQQRDSIEKEREPSKDSRPGSILNDPDIAARLGNYRADSLTAAFNSVRFYLGDLNRDVNDGRVAAYGTDMENGKWWFTPDPIVVTDEGAIINGQHRLLAVERALSEGKLTDAAAPQFVVVWDVDKRAAILMDEARRTTTDRRDIAIRYASASRAA